MPLSPLTERAASQIAATMTAVERGIVRYLASGAGLISVDQLRARLETITAAGLANELDQHNTRPSTEQISAIVDPIIGSIIAAYSTARAARRRVARADPDDGTPWAAVAATLAASTVTFPAVRKAISKAAVDLVPRPLGRSRAWWRTKVAETRNLIAINNAPPGTVFHVRDALKGPTDEPCERVHGQLATREWALRNLSEHLNCTREFRAVTTPERATLR